MINEHGRAGASMCVEISPAGRSCQTTDALESFLELSNALQSIRPCGTDEEINTDIGGVIAEQAVLMRTLSLHKKT